jgi:hypothetical protein
MKREVRPAGSVSYKGILCQSTHALLYPTRITLSPEGAGCKSMAQSSKQAVMLPGLSRPRRQEIGHVVLIARDAANDILTASDSGLGGEGYWTLAPSSLLMHGAGARVLGLSSPITR